MQKVYNMFTGKKAGVILFEVTQEEVQMIKAVLNTRLSELETVRNYYKDTAVNSTWPSTKEGYWKEHSKVTKKINKLAALQAKIKRNF